MQKIKKIREIKSKIKNVREISENSKKENQQEVQNEFHERESFSSRTAAPVLSKIVETESPVNETTSRRENEFEPEQKFYETSTPSQQERKSYEIARQREISGDLTISAARNNSGILPENELTRRNQSLDGGRADLTNQTNQENKYSLWEDSSMRTKRRKDLY